MALFLFISVPDPNRVGFTSVQDGGNLPSQHAPWRLASVGGVAKLGDKADASTVLAGIRRDGFYLAVGGYEDEGPISAARH